MVRIACSLFRERKQAGAQIRYGVETKKYINIKVE
jgi:hypothetical protein